MKVLACGQTIRDVVDARWASKARYRSGNYVIDVNPAENLAGKIDPMRLAVPDPVQNIAAGTVNARQPKNADVRPQRLPRQIRLCRSEEHTSELQSLMRNSYAVFCLKKTNLYKTRQRS